MEFLEASVAVELQQRASEYSSLFSKPQQLRFGLMERMPVVKRGSAADMSLVNGEGDGLTVPHADDTDDLLGFSGEKRELDKRQRTKHSDVSIMVAIRRKAVPVVLSLHS